MNEPVHLRKHLQVLEQAEIDTNVASIRKKLIIHRSEKREAQEAEEFNNSDEYKRCLAEINEANRPHSILRALAHWHGDYFSTAGDELCMQARIKIEKLMIKDLIEAGVIPVQSNAE